MENATNKFRKFFDIKPINIVRNEPLSNFFLRFHPLYGSLAILFMGVFLIGGTAYKEGILFPYIDINTGYLCPFCDHADFATSLMEDINDLALIIFYLPGLFFVSLLYYRLIKNLQVDLLQFQIIGNKTFNSVSEISKITEKDCRNYEEYISFLQKFRIWYCSRWVTFGCIILAINVTYWGFYKTLIGHMPFPYTWHTLANGNDKRVLSISGTFYAIFIFALYIYLFANLLYRACITTIFLHSVFKKFEMNIEFLHPDQCGGLKIVGDLANTFNFAVFIGGINIVSLIYTQSKMGFPVSEYVNLLPLAFYIIMAPIMFFGTIYTTHKVMKNTNNYLQRYASITYDILFRKKISKVYAGTVDNEEIEQLKILEELCKIIKQAPEWPINIQIFRNLLGTMIIPIIMHFSSNIIKIVKRLFGIS